MISLTAACHWRWAPVCKHRYLSFRESVCGIQQPLLYLPVHVKAHRDRRLDTRQAYGSPAR
jgi:hypothetical protein